MWVCLQFSAGSDYPLFSLSARQLNMVSDLGEATGFLWSGCLSSCLWKFLLWSCLFQAMCSYHSDQMSHTIAWPRSCLVGSDFHLSKGLPTPSHSMAWCGWISSSTVRCWHNLGDNVDIRKCASLLPTSHLPSRSDYIFKMLLLSSLDLLSRHRNQISAPSCSCQRSERDLCVYSAHCLTIATEYWKSVPCTPSQTFMFGPNTNFRVSTELCSAVFRKHIQDTLHCICVSPIA